MKTIVIYGSRHGNTRRIAEAIAEGLRHRSMVELISVENGQPVTKDADLIVIGGPTEAHRMTEPIASYLDRLERGALKGKYVAAFDTRLRWPQWLSGSAGSDITTRLQHAGAELIAPAVSFFVAGRLPELVSGELERAKEWGAVLAEMVDAKAPAVARL